MIHKSHSLGGEKSRVVLSDAKKNRTGLKSGQAVQRKGKISKQGRGLMLTHQQEVSDVGDLV